LLKAKVSDLEASMKTRVEPEFVYAWLEARSAAARRTTLGIAASRAVRRAAKRRGIEATVRHLITLEWRAYSRFAHPYSRDGYQRIRSEPNAYPIKKLLN
jgi:hypothetical protein